MGFRGVLLKSPGAQDDVGTRRRIPTSSTHLHHDRDLLDWYRFPLDASEGKVAVGLPAIIRRRRSRVSDRVHCSSQAGQDGHSGIHVALVS